VALKVASWRDAAISLAYIYWSDHRFLDLSMPAPDHEDSVKRALARNELVFHYQPKVGLLKGQVCGVEALLRWVRPDGEIRPPASFLPAAEASGFIHEISLAMFDKLVADFAIIAGINPQLVMSFNLTAQDFATDAIVEKIARAVASNQIDPARLQVELTETTLIDTSPAVRRHVQSVVDMGVSLAMDDFGTGYSTIDVLSQWPFSVVKIDHGLIGRMQQDEKSVTIVRNSIHMAHQLGLRIIAEGVENEEVYDFLLKSGCSEVQGYLLGRPMPLDELLAYLRADKRWAGSPIGLIHMAQSDHLHWRRHLIDYTIGKLYGAPNLAFLHVPQIGADAHNCPLGQWYGGAGRAYSGMSAYDALDAPHKAIHEIAAQICEGIDRGAPRSDIISLLRKMTEKSGVVIALLQELELEALLQRGEQLA
jgi:EAL domain-containing protein (putative c-di-GMP-specific phosphodiesterase class I)